MLSDQTSVDAFSTFVVEVEPRLRRALTATFGPEVGREAAAEALAYGWTHWERVGAMDNAAGYLYRVGLVLRTQASSSHSMIFRMTPNHWSSNREMASHGHLPHTCTTATLWLA